MRPKGLSAALVIQLMIALLAVALPVGASDPTDVLPGGILWRNDPDGGRTWQLQIDDDPTGPIHHVSRYAALPQAVKDELGPHVQDVGTYVHQWGTQPNIGTFGIYSVTTTFGLERVPLYLVENVPADPLAMGLDALLVELAVPAAANQLPYALNYLLPTSLLVDVLVPSYWPPEDYPMASGLYTDHATIYVWTARKEVGAEEVWQGWYLERTGSSGDDGRDAWAERRYVIGPALRTSGQTDHLVGIYVDEDNRRSATPSATSMSQTFTVGVVRDGLDVPLASVVSSDERTDGEEYTRFYPDHQRTGYAVGAHDHKGEFVPLIGTYTESESDLQATTVPHTRTTSVGVFVLGDYQPVAGFRYEGESWPPELWAFFWALSGGPGVQFVDDWEVTIGVFVDGDYVPVGSVQYRDQFAEAHHTYQMMVRVGVYVGGYDGVYVPLVGATYDGQLPMVFAAQSGEHEWIVSSGVFVLDVYRPLAGMKHWPDLPGSTAAAQERYEVGVFLADYDQFVPLLVATWAGDLHSVPWVLGAETQLGMGGRDFEATVGGAAPVGPLLGVHYDSEAESTRPYRGSATVGAFVAGIFVPLVGVAHCSDTPGTAGLHPGSEPDLLVGVYVTGTFVPVARLHVSDDPGGLGLDAQPTGGC